MLIFVGFCCFFSGFFLAFDGVLVVVAGLCWSFNAKTSRYFPQTSRLPRLQLAGKSQGRGFPGLKAVPPG